MSKIDHKFIITRFIPMKQIITAPGKYRTRCGEIVTIHNVNERRNGYGWKIAHGEYSDGIAESWEVSGCVNAYSKSDNDIMEAA